MKYTAVDKGSHTLFFCENGQVFMTINDMPPEDHTVNWRNCFMTRQYCKKNLKRPHFTCFNCIYLRLAHREIYPTIEIQIKNVYQIVGQKQPIKGIFKNILSVTEFLGLYS